MGRGRGVRVSGARELGENECGKKVGCESVESVVRVSGAKKWGASEWDERELGKRVGESEWGE